MTANEKVDAHLPCGAESYDVANTAIGEMPWCRVHDDEVVNEVCLTHGATVHLSVQEESAAPRPTTLAEFARDHEDEEGVARVSALAPGQSVRLGATAEMVITITRSSDDGPVRRAPEPGGGRSSPDVHRAVDRMQRGRMPRC